MVVDASGLVASHGVCRLFVFVELLLHLEFRTAHWALTQITQANG